MATEVSQLESSSPATVTIGFIPDSGILTTSVVVNVSSQNTGGMLIRIT